MSPVAIVWPFPLAVDAHASADLSRGGICAGAGRFHLVMLTQKSFVRLGRPAYHGCMTFWSAKERDGYMNPSSQLKAALSIRTAAV